MDAIESGSSNVAVLDRMLDPLSECLNREAAQRIVGLRIDPAIEARVDVLAERANEGLLSEAERAEYQSYIKAADLIAVFKGKARRYLSAHSGS